MFEIDPHPAIPPADLLKEWEDLWHDEQEHADVLLIRAFQAGADQELDACCEWIDADSVMAAELRAARRPPGPPSLAEEALEAQKRLWCGMSTHDDWHLIRRALERLQELEGGNG